MRLYSLGRWAYTRRRKVLAFWLMLIVVLGVAVLGFGGKTKNSFDIPGTESQDAIDSLGRTFPQLSGTSAYLIVIAPDGKLVTSDRAKSLVGTTVKQIKDVPGVSEAVSPYSKLSKVSISDDKDAAMVQIQFTEQLTDVDPSSVSKLKKTNKELLDAGFTAKFGGDVFTNTGPTLSPTEIVGVVVAFLVLLLALGKIRAAAMPIATAVIGVIVTTELTFISASTITISGTAPLLALMIGLAVGIDYALFIVSRHREQLGEGIAPEESAARAVATAGSAVIFAGVTVMIALIGLSIARIPFLTVMGIVAAIAVLIAVAVALTLLPALLGFAGDTIAPRARKAKKSPARFARRWVGAAIKLPALTIIAVVVALAVVAWPAQDLRLTLPDNGTAPKDSTQRVAYDLVGEHFGDGFNGPLLVKADIITTRDPVGVVNDLADDIYAMPGVKAIGLATPNPTADTGIVQVIPETGPDSTETADLVKAIRDREPEFDKAYGIDVSVTGLTAVGIDVSKRLRDALLPFGLVVVGLSLLLLMAVFRSLLVPIKATIGYLLSVAASFGAVVAVFQWGWLSRQINLEHPGPLISFLPIIVMGVLFGLAMDYEVFLVSRMKEEFARKGDADSAIRDGFAGSSRVVTAAAVIMFAVFAAFVPEGDSNIKPIAFALAVGVFADAFIVRMLFVPAVLKLFGKSAWYLPPRLGNLLPVLDVEGNALHRQVELTDWPEKDSDAAISASGLTAHGPEGLVFNDVNINLGPRGRLLIHGPTGAGKTSLLLALSGRMSFSDGLLRVCGNLLPQEAPRVRREVALAEFTGINDLEDNLTVEQHIAERLSIRSFGLWVSKKKVAPLVDEINDALRTAHAHAGVHVRPIQSKCLISTLSRLERKLLGVALALVIEPKMIAIEDVDDLRAGDDIAMLWIAVDHLIDHRSLGDQPIAVVASALSAEAAAGASLNTLDLDTNRTIDELMF